MDAWLDYSECAHLDMFQSDGIESCISCGFMQAMPLAPPTPAILHDEPQPYIYQPVQPDSEIRLFQLRPGEADEPVRGELLNININARHEYEVVSYTWADEDGDSTRCVRAFMPSGYVLITRSCQLVLQRIRKRYHTKVLWIDSLCVDQNNLVFQPLVYLHVKPCPVL